jgi:hypothetical protein
MNWCSRLLKMTAAEQHGEGSQKRPFPRNQTGKKKDRQAGPQVA